MKTLEELRKLDIAKLLEELNGAEVHFFKVRFEVENGQAKNTHEVTKYRKYIARVKTLINESNSATESKN